LAVAQQLPQGSCQAGDRHLNFHETRDNLHARSGLIVPSPCARSTTPRTTRTCSASARTTGWRSTARCSQRSTGRCSSTGCRRCTGGRSRCRRGRWMAGPGAAGVAVGEVRAI